jgi:hypothetical protein
MIMGQEKSIVGVETPQKFQLKGCRQIDNYFCSVLGICFVLFFFNFVMLLKMGIIHKYI